MTDINKTYEALNSYFLNTATMKINEDYLNLLLNIHIFDSDRRLYEDMHIRRIKSTSLVWRGLIRFANELIDSQEYGRKYTATSAQLKKWLNQYQTKRKQ